MTVHKRLIAFTLAIIIATTTFLFSAYTFHLFNLGGCGTPTGNVPASARFNIVMSLKGYNDNKDHVRPWPIMNVTYKQSVTIHLFNNDTTQAHGFGITHYLDQGVSVPHGQTYDVNFGACQIGTFHVYDTIVDTAELYEPAQLNVNS